MNIQDILLLKNVKRWNIVHVVREQSVAEHSFNVAMIARAIAKEYGIPDERIIKYALDHDLDEVMYGDIPSPAKSRLGIKDDYHGKNKGICSEEELWIVKVSDIIEACHYIDENGRGRHAKQVYGWIENKYIKMINNQGNEKLKKAAIAVMASIKYGEFESEKR